MLDIAQDHRADREDQAWRTEGGAGQGMMDQPAMQAAVPVDIRMDVDEAECQTGGGHDGVHFAACRPLGEDDDTLDQTGAVLGPGADVVGYGLVGVAVVDADETALLSQSQPHEMRVADNDALQTVELGSAERHHACLSDGLAPSRGALAGRRSPSMANDDLESLSRRKAAARAIRSGRTGPMAARACSSRAFSE